MTIDWVTGAQNVAMATGVMKIARLFIKDEEKIVRIVKAVDGYQMMLWKRLVAMPHNVRVLPMAGQLKTFCRN
jgi:hypothetical protein